MKYPTQKAILQTVARALWGGPGTSEEPETFETAYQDVQGDSLHKMILADLCDEAKLDEAGNVVDLSEVLKSLKQAIRDLENVRTELDLIQYQIKLDEKAELPCPHQCACGKCEACFEAHEHGARTHNEWCPYKKEE